MEVQTSKAAAPEIQEDSKTDGTCVKDTRSWRQGSLGPNLGLGDLQKKVTLCLMLRGHRWTTADCVSLDWPKLLEMSISRKHKGRQMHLTEVPRVWLDGVPSPPGKGLPKSLTPAPANVSLA